MKTNSNTTRRSSTLKRGPNGRFVTNSSTSIGSTKNTPKTESSWLNSFMIKPDGTLEYITKAKPNVVYVTRNIPVKKLAKLRTAIKNGNSVGTVISECVKSTNGRVSTAQIVY